MKIKSNTTNKDLPLKIYRDRHITTLTRTGRRISFIFFFRRPL